MPPEIVATLRSEAVRCKSWAVVTEWTQGEGHPVIAIAAVSEGGDMVVSRAADHLNRRLFMRHDAIIVGGSFAGLSAAVCIARGRRVIKRTNSWLQNFRRLVARYELRLRTLKGG